MDVAGVTKRVFPDWQGTRLTWEVITHWGPLSIETHRLVDGFVLEFPGRRPYRMRRVA